MIQEAPEAHRTRIHIPIYVSGSSREIDIVKPYVEKLKILGYFITEDWTDKVQFPGEDFKVSVGDRKQAATLEIRGVEEAIMFWLLVPEALSIGAWVELGLAIRSCQYVIVSGPKIKCTVFTEAASHQFLTHEEAFLFFKRLAPIQPKT